MKLEEFVEESLKQIIKGIVNVKEFGKTNNAYINPATATFTTNANHNIIYCLNTGIPLQQIEFDVAVKVTNERSQKENGEKTVGLITVVGNEQNTMTSDTSLSRIKFSIPILFPTSGQDKDY